MPKVFFHAPEIVDLTEGETEITVSASRLIDVLEEIFVSYPLLRERFLVKREERILLSSTILLFHNRELINDNDVLSYEKPVNGDDEIAVLTPYSGG